MAGPGGQEVARLGVRVLPDTSLFREALLRYLQRIERSTPLRIKVDLDTAGARAALATLGRPQTVPLKPEVDKRSVAGLGRYASELRASLVAAVSNLPAAQVTADTTQADRDLAAVRAKLERLSGTDFSIRANTTKAQAEIGQLQVELERLSRSTEIDVRVNAEKARAALSKITATARVDVDTTAAEGRLAALTRDRKVNVKVDVDKGLADASALLGRQFAKFGSTGGRMEEVEPQRQDCLHPLSEGGAERCDHLRKHRPQVGERLAQDASDDLRDLHDRRHDRRHCRTQRSECGREWREDGAREVAEWRGQAKDLRQQRA